VHKTIIIPHDDKKFRGGEDAASHSTTDDMLVVADGVGGWANKGVNPGLFSRKLTQTITGKYGALTEAQKREKVDDAVFKQLLHVSNHEAAAAHLGSATCTVVRLKDARTLQTLNVGDSTYSIHRRIENEDDNSTESSSSSSSSSSLKVVYAAEPGQKGFNFPYQLGGNYGDQVHTKGVCDGPRTHNLQDKDVIVVVSDGVNDNIDADEYHECIQRYQWSSDLYDKTNNKPTPTTLLFATNYKGYFDEHEIVSYSAVADCIARKAYFLGKDKTHQSPFARSAALYGKRYIGGKHDDITVTVAQVEIAVLDEATGRQVFASDIVVGEDGDASATTSSSNEDPHRNESIFVYKDEDGPIQGLETLPSLDSILKAILHGHNDGVGIGASGDPAAKSEL